MLLKVFGISVIARKWAKTINDFFRSIKGAFRGVNTRSNSLVADRFNFSLQVVDVRVFSEFRFYVRKPRMTVNLMISIRLDRNLQ